MNAVIGLVACDDGFLLLVASSASSSSKGISQLPEQFPDGQRTAPRAEQVPSQLAPSPQAASSNVLFSWQQLTITDSLWNVNTLSKKSMELTLLFPEDKYQRQSAEGSMLTRVSQKKQKSEFWYATYPSGFHKLGEPPEKISAL